MRRLVLAALAASILPALAATSYAGDNVGWKTVDGVILPNGVGPAAVTTVRNIPAAGAPWSTLGGSANFDIGSGEAEFEVRGLVLAGTGNIGTPGAVNSVAGEFICDDNTKHTAGPVPLDAQGNAKLEGNVGPAFGCKNLVFLVTIPGANERWIAYGAVRKP
jgi:hypothetical protein